MNWWNTFFHSRFGGDGTTAGERPTSSSMTSMKLCGWLRMAYALLLILDRLCLGQDLEFFFSPTLHHGGGVLTYQIAQQNPSTTQHTGLWTLWTWIPPHSEAVWLWTFHYLALGQGILLLLGVAPKVQLIGIYINLLSFQHHNAMLWDGEDRMFKLWYVRV
jgi:hypothetical protein